MSKKILVAGGAGFIGTNLCLELLKDPNNEVICVDNCSTGSKSNFIGTIADSKDVFCRNNFEFIRHDIINPIDICVDEIYNLACPASPKAYQRDPIQTLKTSVYGSLNLLELAKKYNAKILLTSTSEIYGDPKEHPQKETYRGNVNPVGIRAMYDEGKRCAETAFFEYKRTYGIDTKIVRLFNTFGEFMSKDDGRVVSNFIVQSLLGKDITIYGDGSQTRSFCYVSDIVYGLMKMMNSNENGPINLGNPEEFTIKEFAEKILETREKSKNKSISNSIYPGKSNIVYLELPQDDPCKRKPDISLAKEKLNWEPEVSVDTGLDLTFRYFYDLLRDELYIK